MQAIFCNAASLARFLRRTIGSGLGGRFGLVRPLQSGREIGPLRLRWAERLPAAVGELGRQLHAIGVDGLSPNVVSACCLAPIRPVLSRFQYPALAPMLRTSAGARDWDVI
jgi:hypothetical protein